MLMDALRLEVGYCLAAADLSQAQVARELRVSTKHLNQMLTGKVAMSIGWAERIALVCGYRLAIKSALIEDLRGDSASKVCSSAGSTHRGAVDDVGSTPAVTT